jgi:hypothetical protein
MLFRCRYGLADTHLRYKISSFRSRRPPWIPPTQNLRARVSDTRAVFLSNVAKATHAPLLPRDQGGPGPRTTRNARRWLQWALMQPQNPFKFRGSRPLDQGRPGQKVNLMAPRK